MRSELQQLFGVHPVYLRIRCEAVSKSPAANFVHRFLPTVMRAMIALAMVRSSAVGVGYFGGMKLGIVTAFHGRHQLTELWCEHTATFTIPVFAAITTGDVINRTTCELHGFVFREMPNNPVGSKFQAALDMAIADGCERVMVLPSDDFISGEWVNRAQTFDAPYFIPARIAVHSPVNGTYALVSDGKSCTRYGAGRVIDRAVIERTGALWPGGRDRSLDSESHGRVHAGGFKCVAVSTKAIPLVDVKTGENIWPWRTWRGSGHRCTADQALHMLNPSARERVSALC